MIDEEPGEDNAPDLPGNVAGEGGTPSRPPQELTATEVPALRAAPDPEEEPLREPVQVFPIVGIGASAGGLAAFEAFFSAMPDKTKSGLSFVLVQHLAPDHKSMLSELVKRYTGMQVFEVQDGMKLQPNCTYIIPPNRDMVLLHGSLQLFKPTAPRGMRLPIDFFFRSLAQDQQDRAICIVLAGTGSDGTLGVRAVKGESGMVMAQAPDSTEFDGMPRSAIATGMVDYVLRPEEMPAQLIAYVSHAYSRRPPTHGAPVSASFVNMLNKICSVLRSQTGHDFSDYKTNTLVRRVQRRMALHQIDEAYDYIHFLQTSPAEIEALFHELLIGVTCFFRDADAFAALQTKGIPRILANKAGNDSVRVWVCGCSTGEEAYSIAILIQEHMETLGLTLKVQVFATDIDKRSIERARGGVFPVSIALDVTPERLARYFVHDPEAGVYRIHKVIRDQMIFSQQDVIKDPPFSKLDMISCRNLLIYLNGDLQKKLMALFHYALLTEGVLFLGTSETVGGVETLFKTLDRKEKLYLRQERVPGVRRPALGNLMPSWRRALPGLPITSRGQGPADGKDNLRELIEHALLQHYVQAGILVTRRGEILHIYGRTGKYLEPAPGNASMFILPMAREGLRRELTTALHRVSTTQVAVDCPGLQIKTNGDAITARLIVTPVLRSGDGGKRDLFLVVLEEQTPATEQGPTKDMSAIPEGRRADELKMQISSLKQELRAKEEYLQTALEEMETSNESLKSANEEAQSVNEELQSTNEELETSKEELQSVNEELATVNIELQTKLTDLSRANNDMNNLLAGTGVGTLFVDQQLCITRFTPDTTRVINLIPSDLGRPVGHIAAKLKNYDCLVDDIQSVLDTLNSVEAEVESHEGLWFLMRIRPYRTLENVIEGTVITFIDITERKRAAASLQSAQESVARSIVATVREPLIVLDEQLRVISVNASFYKTFGTIPDQTIGNSLYELGNKQWDIPRLRELLEEILPRNVSFEDFEMSHEFEELGLRRMRLNARRLAHASAGSGLILLAIEDVTDSAP